MRIYYESDDRIVHCSLEHAELARKPKYTTLFYTLGVPTHQADQKCMTDQRCCSIVAEDQELLVTEDLVHFLRHMALLDGIEVQFCWIDAIFIVQIYSRT